MKKSILLTAIVLAFSFNVKASDVLDTVDFKDIERDVVFTGKHFTTDFLVTREAPNTYRFYRPAKNDQWKALERVEYKFCSSTTKRHRIKMATS